ncbi:hypothetical protein [Acidomonas methanolica]|uniref:hypothetical protein n=1 Tax=Acidomonas methanolica TaxID=437 RepID=UPI00211A0CE2|nr:hypothetical protein [Acidomonas methanolica]MCQ9156398.1 hypothetical protein [Acidomonas methanolica]
MREFEDERQIALINLIAEVRRDLESLLRDAGLSKTLRESLAMIADKMDALNDLSHG